MADGRTRSIYVPPWRVDITTRPTAPRLLAQTALARLTAAALTAARAPSPASIGLILSDDAELADLNLRHMGHEGPTDVLSFPLIDSRSTDFKLPPGSRVHLGDIVVSVERAMEQAQQGRGGQMSDLKWSAKEELRLLVVHGTLHICGWDHAQPEEEAAMRALEKKILGKPA
jgi:probable rRNA maturation factor